MKKHLLISCLALLLWGAGPARAVPQAATPAPTDRAASAAEAPAVCPPPAAAPTEEQVRAALPTAPDRGFLWRLRKDGRTSWLYGTVHLGRSEWVVPGPQLRAAFQQSDVVALELDPTDPEVMQRLLAAPKREPKLSAELTERLRRHARAACVAEQVMEVMSPELLSATVLALSARADGLSPELGIDLVYALMARRAGKPIVSLETAEQQIGSLSGANDEETEATVRSNVEQLEKGTARPVMRRTAEVWAASRLEELSDWPRWCECMNTEADRSAMKRMLDDRNGPLADAIARQHADGKRVFAAVGSLHLVGPQGVPALLAARGFQVTRVTFRAPAR